MENKTYYLTYVVGERGVGKTTLLAHFATEYMIPPRSIDDLKLCRKEIGRLRAGGWDNLSLAPHVQHLVYVVDDTFIARGLGMKVKTDEQIWKKVWSPQEKVNFSSTPLFLVHAAKPE